MGGNENKGLVSIDALLEDRIRGELTDTTQRSEAQKNCGMMPNARFTQVAKSLVC